MTCLPSVFLQVGGGSFLCGRGWRKEGKWGFPACLGDEQGFQANQEIERRKEQGMWPN